MLLLKQKPHELTNGCFSITGNFWIVNQIIGRGLHTSDDDVKQYTTDLVDKLEQVRRAHDTPAAMARSPWRLTPLLSEFSSRVRMSIMMR